MSDWRIRLNEADEQKARELAFNGGRYPQDETSRLLRLALHEIDCLREDKDQLAFLAEHDLRAPSPAPQEQQQR